MESNLGARSWTDLADAAVAPVLLVPIGATEQHGPHLPLGTDTFVAEAVARRAAEALRDTASILVTPSVAITASGEHQGFPGTLSIGTPVMTAVLVELVRSADWAAGVVLVNGHGGNLTAVTAAVEQLGAEGRRVHAWWPRVPGGDPHAGHVETSMMLALDPALVRRDRAVAGPIPSMDRLRADGLAAHSPSGVLGDPTRADATVGADLLAALSADLVATVQDRIRHWGVGEPT